jgi:hypothetical protein
MATIRKFGEIKAQGNDGTGRPTGLLVTGFYAVPGEYSFGEVSADGRQHVVYLERGPGWGGRTTKITIEELD